MKLRPARLDGSWHVEIQPIGDERGFFARVWDEAVFASVGVTIRNVQTNLSYNRRRGTIRGLHWQEAPNGDTKLVRCTRGSIFDVAVDLRPGSPTYRQWQGVILSAEERNLVLVPAGCAHGYQALDDDAEVTYQVSHAYVPASERGLRWDDPAIGIVWPITDDITVSPKDQAWPALEPSVAR